MRVATAGSVIELARPGENGGATRSTAPVLTASITVAGSATRVSRIRAVLGASPHQLGFGVSTSSRSLNALTTYGWADIDRFVAKSAEMSEQSATAACLTMASKRRLCGEYGTPKWTTTWWSLVPGSTDEIRS